MKQMLLVYNLIAKKIIEALRFSYLMQFTIPGDEVMKEFLIKLGAAPTLLSILKQILDVKINDTSI